MESLKKDPKSLIDVLRHRAENQPQQKALIFLEDGETEVGNLTYEELDIQARLIAIQLQKLVKPGERALLIYPSGLEFVSALWGCFYAGVVAVPVYISQKNHQLTRELPAIFQEIEPQVILTSTILKEQLQAALSHHLKDSSHLFWLTQDSQVLAESDLWQPPSPNPEQLALIQYSSGTTNKPKGIKITHQNLLFNLASVQDYFSLTSEDVSISWLPHYHYTGLCNGIMQPLYTGFLGVILPTITFFQKPVRWLEAITRYRATYSGGPSFAYDLCLRKITESQKTTLDLKTWSCAYTALEPIESQILEQFSQTFQECGFNEQSFSPCYSLGEATFTVTALPKNQKITTYRLPQQALESHRVENSDPENQEYIREIVSCGYPLPNTEIVIVDPKTLQECSPNQVGEIWLKSPSVAQGYWQELEETEKTFQACLKTKQERGFLRTGDLGFFREGQLFITGRFKDLITLGSRYCYPQDIEKTIPKSHPSIKPYRSVVLPDHQTPEKLSILTEIDLNSSEIASTSDAVIEAIREQVLRKHNLSIDTIALLAPGSLPETPSGKISHYLCYSFPLEQNPQIIRLWTSSAQEARKKRDKNGFFPLSYGQQALWWLYRLSPESVAYNLAVVLDIDSTLDIPALHQTFEDLVNRHPMLKARFIEKDGEPFQMIEPTEKVNWEIIDATDGNEQKLPEKIQATYKRPFNLQQESPFRVSLFNRSSSSSVLVLTFHHIVSDGWSIWMLVDEMRQIYAAITQNKSLELPRHNSYQDYVNWQLRNLSEVEGKRLKDYWQQKLAGELPILNLPTDRPRQPRQALRGEAYSFVISPQLREQVYDLARSNEVSLYRVLMTAFQVLLYRYTGQEDILVGSPTAGREKAEFKNTFGYLVNPVVIRTNFADNLTFRQCLAQVNQTVTEAIAHRDYPFPLIVEALHPDRNPSYSPIFQAVLVIQRPQIEGVQDLLMAKISQKSVNWGGIMIKSAEMIQPEEAFDLTLEITQAKNYLLGSLRYNTDLFDKTTIIRLAQHFQTLLTEIVANPEGRVSEFSLLTPEEKQQILIDWNNTGRDYPAQQCIHQLFEEQVAKNPDAIALVYGEEELTYGELNEKANQLAHYLQDLGVRPETLTAICLERSFEMVIGILAILKTGGAYVPLDSNYPRERLEYILEDAQISILLSQEKLKAHFEDYQGKIILLDSQWSEIEEYSRVNLSNSVSIHNLAYAIYTSGSTGTPKGVLIEHKGLLNLSKWHQRVFAITPQDKATQLAGTAFDASVWEIWPYLSRGATLYLVKGEMLAQPVQLRNWIIKQGITITFIPTPLTEALISLDWPQDTPLKWLLTGGDQLHNYPPTGLPFQVVNNYGPTENTVVTTSTILESLAVQKSSPSIGKPIDNTQVYILNENLQPVPIGVPGEIHIAGLGLARGYLNREDLTQEKFIKNPFDEKGETRVYKSGDLGRYLPNGDIEFLGRIDHQVKLRGFRIELGEIESLLKQHPDVQDAIVIAKEDEYGYKRLVAYVVSLLMPERLPYHSSCIVQSETHIISCSTEDLSNKGIGLKGDLHELKVGQKVQLRLQLPGGKSERWLSGQVAWKQKKQAGIEFQFQNQDQEILNDSYRYLMHNKDIIKVEQRSLATSIRNFLQKKLPDYMIPSAFMLLESLPLTPNGKIDRKALPDPQQLLNVLSSDYIPPRTPTEEILARIWQQVLRLEKISINKNFFELGGDSILSLQIMARANQAGLKLTPKHLFTHQTIASLAQAASLTNRDSERQEITTGQILLTPIQNWFFEQKFTAYHHFNQAVLLEISPRVSLEELEIVWQKLIEYHDGLRLRFRLQGDQWQPTISDVKEKVALEFFDLSELTTTEKQQVITTQTAQLQTQLNLSEGPLIQIALFRVGQNQPNRLFIVIHHLAIDGVSWRILLEDFVTVYEQMQKNQHLQLPPKTTSLRTWSQQLREYAQTDTILKELNYWLTLSQEAIIDLPVDYKVGVDENTIASTRTVLVSLTQEQTRSLLQDIPSVYNTQINDILLSALVQCLAQWTEGKTFLVNLEGHGREQLWEDVDLSRTVGWFTSLFPVVLTLEDHHPEPLLKSIKEQLRQIPNKGIGYGILRYLHPEQSIRTQLHNLPKAQISFNYLGQFDQLLQKFPIIGFARESSGSLYDPTAVRDHLIEINSLVKSGKLQLEWSYSEKVHQRNTVEGVAQSFLEALKSVITHCQSPDAGGYTPSDFVAARLNQQQLDKLITQIQKKQRR